MEPVLDWDLMSNRRLDEERAACVEWLQAAEAALWTAPAREREAIIEEKGRVLARKRMIEARLWGLVQR